MNQKIRAREMSQTLNSRLVEMFAKRTIQINRT